MIVICPNCLKRYMLDDNLLPKEGRQVRCLACHHIWRQVPDAQPLLSGSPLRGIMDMAVETGLSPERKSRWLVWVILLAMGLSLFSSLTFGRDFVVKLWPGAEKFYNLVGLHASPLGAKLSIANATSMILKDGSVDMVQVAGDVVNISDRVQPIPPLKIKLMGEALHPKCLDKHAEGCVLDYWEYRLSESFLLPGEQIHFETEPRPQVGGTQHISVEF